MNGYEELSMEISVCVRPQLEGRLGDQLTNLNSK